jgi:hypothetical protein
MIDRIKELKKIERHLKEAQHKLKLVSDSADEDGFVSRANKELISAEKVARKLRRDIEQE